MSGASERREAVDHPDHYQTAAGVECIVAMEAATEGLSGSEAICVSQVIKYIWRWKQKGGLEDLKKCQWYLNRLVDRVAARVQGGAS